VITSDAWRGRRFAVLGLARSGAATVAALLASGAEVVAWDADEARRAAVPEGVALADPLAIDLHGFDGVVVSPGVPLNRHPIAGHARAAGVPVIGDVELFARARGSLPPHKVVGITGTNGKSTTTALIHHILQTAGVPSLMGGNIGLPILGRDPLPAGGVYVLELSSYQLDLTFSLDCDVAVLTNITPDHLDRYDGFEAYAASKARLFEMQSLPGSAVIVGEDEPSRRLAEAFRGRLIQTAIGTWIDDGVSLCESKKLRLLRPSRTTPNSVLVGDDIYGAQADFPALQGPHNALNLVAAVAACYALLRFHDVYQSDQSWSSGLESFPGLPHRMERVGERGGVLFVNDSKATNATATAPALAAYPAIHWILGGLPKTDELDDCAPHFGHVRAGYTIGQAGPLFAGLLRAAGKPVTESGTLDQAVRDAAAAAKPGEVVMLSPACASFDQFRDYEARGDAFRAAVAAL